MRRTRPGRSHGPRLSIELQDGASRSPPAMRANDVDAKPVCQSCTGAEVTESVRSNVIRIRDVA